MDTDLESGASAEGMEMKFVKLLLGTLAALWTVGVIAGVIKDLGDHSGTRGVAQFAAGVGVTALCAAISAAFFRKCTA